MSTLRKPDEKEGVTDDEEVDTGPEGSKMNGRTIARELGVEDQDAIVLISGDGVVHEVLNGLASRPDALKALRIPVVPIPAGSGNALCVNLVGRKRVLDFAYCALLAIKGTS